MPDECIAVVFFIEQAKALIRRRSLHSLGRALWSAAIDEQNTSKAGSRKVKRLMISSLMFTKILKEHKVCSGIVSLLLISINSKIL